MSTDAKYFQSTKKGEIHELKADLNSLKEETKKDAVKKVIALMTVGKDVSRLFTDVLKCITTTNLELKKLVYLYIMNYAKNNEEMAILAVNTFQQDCSDQNPLVRSLALRTMGCLRVEKIIEYLCDPLSQCLKDPHPYVAKTAAICVAKLYDSDPELVENRGFIDDLKGLLSDSNPLVVANAVAALVEIDEVSATPVFTINRSILGKLVAALEESSEWAQCYILNSLARYTPRDGREAKTIIDKILPLFQHANSAVVMGAVRVVMIYLDQIDNKEYAKTLISKLKPPLVSMLNREPEVKYVALRNIALILQKRPSVLSNEIEVFYCKYRDPIYVKMEKLEIMVMLVNEKNIDQVLLEFKEYSQNVDVEFVRKVVRTIGRTAIHLDKAADKCVHLLLDLIKTSKVSHVIEESITVLKDIFRKYPLQYESLVSSLVEQGEAIEDPEARASLVWIIGEYVHQLADPVESLQPYVARFVEDTPLVQQQVLTAVVKVFLKRPKDPQAKQLLEEILDVATNEVENPDTRDRGFVYLRLLSIAPDAAKQVVLAERPTIVDDSTALEASALNGLIANISTLSSVYHKPPGHFVPKMKISEGRGIAVVGSKKAKKPITNGNAQAPEPAAQGGLGLDLLGLGGSSPAPVAAVTAYSGPIKPTLTTSLPADNPSCPGLQVDTMFVLHQDQVKLRMLITNQSSTTLESFLLRFKANIFGATPAATQVNVPALAPGAQGKASVTINLGGERGEDRDIQVALKSALGVALFLVSLPFQTTLLPNGRIDTQTFASLWKQQQAGEAYYDLREIFLDVDTINNRMEENGIFYVTKAEKEGSRFLYYSAKMADNTGVLLELELSRAPRLCVNTSGAWGPLVAQTVQEVLA